MYIDLLTPFSSITIGKMVRINGRKFLLVGMFHMFLGDAPGRCLTFGIKESSNYHEAPCHCCHVRHHDFGASIDNADLRTLRNNADFRDILSANNNRAGLPNNELARIIFLEHGINHATVLGTFPGVSEYLSVAIDVMHSLFLGEWYHLVEEAADILSPNISDYMLPTGKTKNAHFFETLSSLLQSSYAKYNNARKACKQRFTTFSQWKGLNASGIKIFAEVSMTYMYIYYLNIYIYVFLINAFYLCCLIRCFHFCC